MKTIKSVKRVLKIIVLVSAVYTFLALLAYIKYTEILFFDTFYFDFAFNFHDSVKGLMFVVYVILFVSFILASNAFNSLVKKEEDKNIFSVNFSTILKLLIFLNIAGAFFYFSKVNSEIGGDIVESGGKYEVYYRAEYIKTITAQEAEEFSNANAQVTIYLAVSVLLFFTGMLFLNSLDTYLEINDLVQTDG